MRFRKLTLASTAFLLAALSGCNSLTATAATCASAAHSAEQRNGLPSGLLTAIGDVESSGWGPSVNSNDGLPGQRFATALDARRYTERLMDLGLRTIDVGCFQIDLRYHPDAFQRWQDAFDETTNADAAAAILNRLHAQTGDWSRAVALYHSADLQRGASYLEAVMSAWSAGPGASRLHPGNRSRDIELQTIVIPVAVWGPETILTPISTPLRRRDKLPQIITP